MPCWSDESGFPGGAADSATAGGESWRSHFSGDGKPLKSGKETWSDVGALVRWLISSPLPGVAHVGVSGKLGDLVGGRGQAALVGRGGQTPR